LAAWKGIAEMLRTYEEPAKDAGLVSQPNFERRLMDAEEYSPLARLILDLAPLWFFLFLAGIVVFMVVVISWLAGGAK